MENLKEYFEEQRKQKDVFNIFKVLHKEADEKHLHSRFISYLLSTNKEYLKLFLSVLGINNFETEDCQVRPNKQNKSEFENIDILIFNKKQAIIVENKIFAGDQPRQLEKYFETITTGENEIGEKEVVCISYLTLDRHEPTPDSLGNKLTVRIDEPNKKIVKLIDYTQNITKWLDDCTVITKENDLRASICQYKRLVQELTSNIEQAKKNQELLSNLLSSDIESALKLKKYLIEDCFEIFKHIQWHTVDDFINELSKSLPDVTEKPMFEEITKVTHKEIGNSIHPLIIKFRYKGEEMQICNDRVNGFTLGNLKKGKWDYFSNEIKNVRFCDFSNNETFSIISEKKREEIIAKIVEEVEEKYLDLIFDFKK